ncbi:hypothetical protein PR002_g12446 [Phytophthora rubi]|uniref:DUF659 domain-containing protein n=1 Tax=Phytophthora rubi TaxID=129364 RepID=A0A6A3LWV3_9STRA|nr:hypothetical protein PR002_g12446 [Phytophthora rubi]
MIHAPLLSFLDGACFVRTIACGDRRTGVEARRSMDAPPGNALSHCTIARVDCAANCTSNAGRLLHSPIGPVAARTPRYPPTTHLNSQSRQQCRVDERPLWQEFIYSNGTYPDAICNHCSLKLFKCQPSRNLLKHLVSCPNLAEPERAKWRRYGEPIKKQKSKRQKRKKRSATHSPEATQESVLTGTSLSQSQPTTPYVGGIAREEKKRFQSDIARGFYAAGLPFRAIEVPRICKALTVLQPDLEKHLPTRKALAGILLTDEYQREKDELVVRLRDEPTLGVVSDGWSSVSKEKVVNYIVVSPLMRPQLWCTRRTGVTEPTSEYVAEEIGSVIDEINLAAGIVVEVSVTTDNAPVMQKAWDILERERQLACNVCSSYALNLILEEVLSLSWSSTSPSSQPSKSETDCNYSPGFASYSADPKRITIAPYTCLYL